MGMEALWAQIDGVKMPEEARIMAFNKAATALHSHMADLLRAGGCGDGPSGVQAAIGSVVEEMANDSVSRLADEARNHVDAIKAELVAAGAPDALARKVAQLFALDGAIGLALLSRDSKVPPAELVDSFVGLGAKLGLDWAQAQASVMVPSDPWERLLVSGIARDFQQMRLDFLRSLAGKGKGSIADKVEAWAKGKEAPIRHFRSVVSRAQASSPVSAAALAQIASQSRNLLQG